MTTHPLTEARARELWDARRDGVSWDELERDQRANALADMRSGYDAGRDTTADDGWEYLDWDENPARIGDEVEITDDHFGVTHANRGVIVSFNYYDDPCTMTDGRGLIGERECGTWRVRRKSLDPLADLAPGTIIRDVILMKDSEVGDAIISSYADGLYISTADDWNLLDVITAFTTDDRTIRYTRHGDTWTAEILEPEL